MTDTQLEERRVQRLTDCPACGSPDLRPFLRGEDYHYGNDGTFEVDRCQGCGLWVLAPMPDAVTLSSFYPSDYYSFQPPTASQGWKSRIRKMLRLERVTYLPPLPAPGSLLDVGCGAGHYIFELARRGWSVAGVEPSAAAVAAGRAAGLSIHHGEIQSADFRPASFDVIRLNHSFEHVPDLAGTLHAARKLLKESGFLFIGVPNTDGLWARLFGRWWWYLGLPVHTYGFNPRNLSRLLERAGFEVMQVRYNAEYTGLLGSLQIWLNRHKRPRRSTGAVLNSWILRLPALWLCKLLDLMQLGDCIEVIARPSGPRKAIPRDRAPAPV